MFPTATIVFREVLEIALVLGVVLASTQGLVGRYKLVLWGLLLGVCGAAIIAFFTDSIANAIDGVGQEVFNAAIMFVAVGFLSWTVVFMKRHGAQVAQQLKIMGADVLQGRQPPKALVAVVALATFREGAEIVLFTYGMLASKAYTWSSILAGGALGLVGGAVVGTALYLGLLKTLKKHLFTVTSWLLILLTAGMAAQGASFLIAADLLPAIIDQVWDTSWLLSGQSLLGEMLHVLVGYNPQPSGTELAFYVAMLAGVGFLYTRPKAV